MPKKITNVRELPPGIHFLIAENGFYYEQEQWHGPPDPKPSGGGSKIDIVNIYSYDTEAEWIAAIKTKTEAKSTHTPMKVVVPVIKTTVEVNVDINYV